MSRKDFGCFPALLLLALSILLVFGPAPTNGDEGKAIPGLISFEITGIEKNGSTCRIEVGYDATSAGNPWEGGIYGYGEIEKLRRATIWMMVFRNETRAETFVTAAADLYPDGYSSADPIYWIRKHAENKYGVSVIPEPGLNGDSRTGALPGDTPLSGTLDADLTLRKLPANENLFAVFWASMEYEAFGQYMYNIDYIGPIPVNYRPGVFLSIAGPGYITAEDEEVIFDLSISGGDVDELARVDWVLEYWSGGNWTTLPPIYGSLTSGLTLDRNRLASYFDLLEEHGEDGELEMRVSANAFRVFRGLDPVATSNVHYFTLGTEGKVRGRMVALAQKFPVKHIALVFSNGEVSVETSTDSYGRFEIPPEMLSAEEFDLEILFQYVLGERTCFSMHHNFVFDPLTLRLTLSKNEVIEVALILKGTYSRTVQGIEAIPELRLDELMAGMPSEGLDNLYTYLHLAEALDFYTDYLGVYFDGVPPLNIQTSTSFLEWNTRFVPQAIWNGTTTQAIVIDASSMDHGGGPYQEYHEFSHYAMYEIYGGFPESPPGPVEEVNHGGYANPTTADSFVEGFAHFMSMVMGEHYDFWWSEEDYPSLCNGLGDFELDYLAWGHLGKGEEYAIAGILWDLYDGDEQHQKRIEITRSLYERNLQLYDTSENGLLERDELFLRYCDNICRMRFGYSWSSLLEYLIRVYDGDGDEFFDRIELGKVVEDKILTSYVFWDLGPIDPDTILVEWGENGRLDLEGILLWLIDLKTEDAEKITNELPEKEGLGELLAGISPEDDDGVSLEFDRIWDIISRYHGDFTSVYEALAEEFPGIKGFIDQIFVNHGFFADRDRGNGVYDEGEPTRNGFQYNEGDYFVDLADGDIRHDIGEEIGRATNYNRTDRRSHEYLPGHFVRVDNDWTWYRIEFEIFDDPDLSYAAPSKYFVLREGNRDGMVYVPVPPRRYNATVTMKPDGVETNVSLTFTSKDFYDDYADSIERGFFVEHKFNIVEWLPPILLFSLCLLVDYRRRSYS